MAAISLVFGSVIGFFMGIASIFVFGFSLLGALFIWSVVGGTLGVALAAFAAQTGSSPAFHKTAEA